MIGIYFEQRFSTDGTRTLRNQLLNYGYGYRFPAPKLIAPLKIGVWGSEQPLQIEVPEVMSLYAKACIFRSENKELR